MQTEQPIMMNQEAAKAVDDLRGKAAQAIAESSRLRAGNIDLSMENTRLQSANKDLKDMLGRCWPALRFWGNVSIIEPSDESKSSTLALSKDVGALLTRLRQETSDG